MLERLVDVMGLLEGFGVRAAWSCCVVVEQAKAAAAAAAAAAPKVRKGMTDEQLARRCVILKDSVTKVAFLYINRGLFEKDKLMVAAQLCFQVCFSLVLHAFSRMYVCSGWSLTAWCVFFPVFLPSLRSWCVTIGCPLTSWLS